MKKIFNTLFIATLAIIFLSCKDDEIKTTETATTGSLDLASLVVSYDPSAQVLRSTDVNRP